ncbi:helix-turn-helix domain-containing protein [bacterium]|nr:helix-turn-helix domain-containing protein [bacterium]
MNAAKKKHDDAAKAFEDALKKCAETIDSYSKIEPVFHAFDEISLSDDYIASKLRITRATVNRWRNGKRTPEPKYLIACNYLLQQFMERLVDINDANNRKLKIAMGYMAKQIGRIQDMDLEADEYSEISFYLSSVFGPDFGATVDVNKLKQRLLEMSARK